MLTFGIPSISSTSPQHQSDACSRARTIAAIAAFGGAYARCSANFGNFRVNWGCRGAVRQVRRIVVSGRVARVARVVGR